MNRPSTDIRGADLLYLDLLKKCLTRYGFGPSLRAIEPQRGSLRRAVYAPLGRFLAKRGIVLARRERFDPERRAVGHDWPADAETMIGLRRLDNLQSCVADVLRDGVPGDLIEAGAWRGGATIFMRALLEIYGDLERKVWVADSFEGLPKPDPGHYPVDSGDRHWTQARLAVSLEEVKENFARYGLLDDRVRFLPGWFRDTLPTAPIERLSVLRLDGDMYESTMDALVALYPKLSPGGYAIIDDYGALLSCKQAVDDFRNRHQITEDLERIDWTGVFWRRLR